MKTYNFDEIVPRKGTGCVKHDMLNALYGRDDLLPMWVADMDFRTPDFIIDALRRRLDHEVLGYALPTDSYWETMCRWLREHYNIKCRREELHFIPGIVAGIAYVIQAFTQPEDTLLVTTPVYPPFLNLPKTDRRRVECSPLRVVEGRFAIDFDDLEQRAKGCQWMILSNPHNPGGTVWGEETLRRVADICLRNGVRVIADEIHADMTLPGHKHVSYSTVSPEAREESITFVAPSKTFNIAGLGSSVCYCANEELRHRFYSYLDGYGVAGGNIFAFIGAEAAFGEGEDWRQQMLAYLQGNVECLRDFLAQQMPAVKAVLPEASYLAWLDFTALGHSHKELENRLVNSARVALNDGTTFGGEAYDQCFRINLGCPRATLTEALERIAKALL